MNEARFADEIRERERVRRRREMLWNAASVAFHVALVAAIVWMTPARSLITERKKKNPAEHLPPERIEQISDALSQARVNELLRQLEALKTVLHNMDLMKEQLQGDYDAFAGESAEDVKQSMLRALDEAEAAQKTALAEQAPVVAKVERMFAEERLDLMDEQRSKWLFSAAENLVRDDGDKIAGAQARAGNALDRIQVQAGFAGYRRTAEASEKVRDAQLEAAAMQNRAQKEASEIGFKMSDVRSRTLELERHGKWLADEKERLAKAEADRKDAEAQLADAAKLRDAAGRARDAAKAEEQRLRDECAKADAEAKAAREESARLANELKAARAALEKARKERDRAAAAEKKGGA
jgi:hypothetical protein